MKVVKVLWVDSCNSNMNWTFAEDIEIEPMYIESFGVVIKDTDEFLAIAQNYGDNPEQYSNITTIPKGCIKEVFVIHDDKRIAWIEKQSGKPQGKSIKEAWKDMRLEVYQQASGNRHEPNYTDDSTKMFSLNDIDEIIEKINEQTGKVDNQNCAKSTDKVEPKFMVGDWLCENEPNNYARFIQILEVVNVQGKERYRISKDLHNDEDIIEADFIEKYYHKFDIKDAKEGDVLTLNGEVFIYAHRKQLYSIAVAHCFVDSVGDFHFDGEFGYVENGNSTCPATQKQRNTLFAKMKEDGCEWDAEKKQLKFIKLNGMDS